MSPRTALYPGSFDPVTFGHVDLIRRSLSVADRLVISILPNAAKEALLPLADRAALLRSVVASELADLADRISIRSDADLAVRIAADAGATMIVRMAHANRLLAPGIETLFLMTAPEHASTSSRLVREIARYGGPLERLVPAAVVPVLAAAAAAQAKRSG